MRTYTFSYRVKLGFCTIRAKIITQAATFPEAVTKAEARLRHDLELKPNKQILLTLLKTEI